MFRPERKVVVEFGNGRWTALNRTFVHDHRLTSSATDFARKDVLHPAVGVGLVPERGQGKICLLFVLRRVEVQVIVPRLDMQRILWKNRSPLIRRTCRPRAHQSSPSGDMKKDIPCKC